MSFLWQQPSFCTIDVLFEYHLKFWNSASIDIPVLTAQQKGTTARWYLNNTSLIVLLSSIRDVSSDDVTSDWTKVFFTSFSLAGTIHSRTLFSSLAISIQG